MPDLLNVLYALFLAGAVYGGIRVDLKNLHRDVKRANRSARRAHKRIDRHVEKNATAVPPAGLA